MRQNLLGQEAVLEPFAKIEWVGTAQQSKDHKHNS
jgi:hypothetical protein